MRPLVLRSLLASFALAALAGCDRATSLGGDGAAGIADLSMEGADAGGATEDLATAGATPDPNLDGPYAVAELDGQYMVTSTRHTVKVHAAYPTAGQEQGAIFPVVFIAHGFQLPIKQYYGYARRLASFGYVAVLPDFTAGFLGANNVENAKDVLGVLDWIPGQEVGAHADLSRVGASGHSLGGKVAVIAASMEPRIQAVFAIDPVDSAVNCSPQNCPDASGLVPSLTVPTGFLGEKLDGAGGFMPCAPAADNYTTFYAGAKAPSVELTAVGANHMSFLDDVATCGITCNFCQKPSATNAEVNAMSKALMVSFYERHLRGDARYDEYLTGAKATARYVAKGKLAVRSK